MLVDIHEGIYGGHFNGLSMAQRLLRAGYYWPTMQTDAVAFEKSCEKCQKHGNLIHAPGRELIPSNSHWSFQHWAFDLVGQIHPNSLGRHKFIITTTDYILNG